MTRKATPRRVWIPVPPRGLRPRLAHDQVQDLSLVHHVNLDSIATGQADAETLWQTLGGALTWSRIAERLGLGEAEMAVQLQMLEHVTERYVRTGRVGFTGAEYQLAKVGVQVQDELARIVDRHTAVEAANWSEERVNRMCAACPRGEAA